jgi:transcription elongation GreA/GreB family factor
MTDEERQKLCEELRDCWLTSCRTRRVEAAELETAADLIEQLAHELLATNERLEQLEARLEALERM